MNNVINFYLVKETNSKDAVGQTITKRENREVLGLQDSIGQTEFYKADQAGIRASFRIIMTSIDYENEDELIIDSETFSIYRTFKRGSDKIELYCGKRVGNNG